MKIIESITNKFLVPLKLLPAAGLPAEKLAFSITLGIVAGLFPVIGTTTLLSLLLTMLFKQNILVVQSVQWTTGIFQILLIIPLMRFGAFILNIDNFHINIRVIKTAFQAGVASGIKTLGIFHLYAILSWILFAIPASAILYFTIHAFFQLKKPL
jgi:hypothetical protein